jgi:hypothetical protein
MISTENWKYFPARELVKIDLAGTKFYLDLRLWECREVDDFSNKFSLDQLYDHPSGGFICCFDPKTKNLFEGTKEQYEARKHELEIVRLPSIKKMDPIGHRAMIGLPPRQEKKSLLEKKRTRKKSRGKKL